MTAPIAYPLHVDAALAYRQGEPGVSPERLLVLIHGVGGNETNLVALGRPFLDDTLVVFPRGPLAIGPGQFAWFPVRFGANGPEIDFVVAQRSTQLLDQFIKTLQSRHGIPPSRTVVAGFSQGGIMSANVALTAPERVAGFAVISGRILPEIEPHASKSPELLALDGLVLHGSQDNKLSPSWAHGADALLRRLDVPHATSFHAAGHEITQAMQDDFVSWFQRADARWNTADRAKVPYAVAAARQAH